MRFWAGGFGGLGPMGIFTVDNIVDDLIKCI